MSEYRLNEQQVQKLDLVPTTWEKIKEGKIKGVYIRAHEYSPVYGPYKVQSATECVISKLDGSEHRSYPRNKGLLVPRWNIKPEHLKQDKPEPRKLKLPGKVWRIDPRKQTIDIGTVTFPLKTLETVEVVRDIIEVLTLDITEREQALDKLEVQRDILCDLLYKLENK
jgi:hypothetical protein